MADETTNLNQTEGNVESNVPAEKNVENAHNDEPTISKALFDRKVSEMNKKIKELQAEKLSKMSEDEKAAAEHEQMMTDLKAAQNELAELRTSNELITAGIKPDTAKVMATAIIGGNSADIVKSIKEAISTAVTEATATAKQEILDKGAANIGVGGGKQSTPEDKMTELVKSATQTSVQTKSKWLGTK